MDKVEIIYIESVIVQIRLELPTMRVLLCVLFYSIP